MDGTPGHPWSSGICSGSLTLGGSWAEGQGPTIDTPDIGLAGRRSSALGRSPGSGGAGPSISGGDTLLGGRAGPTTSKGITSGISTPGQQRSGFNVTDRQGLNATPDQAPASIPAAGPLALPPTEEDPGPRTG